jgi:hypothetical protein
MLADPQSVTINAVAISLPKTQSGPTQSTFTSADGLTSLTTKQNTTASRFRREVRVSQKKISADPISAVTAERGVSVYLVIDEPRNNIFSDAEIGYLIAGLKSLVDSTFYNKILGGEF